MSRTLIGLMSIAWASVLTASEPWPQFRGVDAGGTSDNSTLPLEWSTEKNVHWKIEVPGVAWSSPIIWENRVYLTTAIPDGKQEAPKPGLYFGAQRKEALEQTFSWEVWALDLATGKRLWKQVAHQSKPPASVHQKNTYASETPATDGQHVVAFFGPIGLYCYDIEGKLLWKKDMGVYKTRLGWGTASSPILDDGKIYVQYDNEEKSYVAAFETKTGKQLWRADREEISSWATPLLWKRGNTKELVTAATKRVRSYDPNSGKLLWELGGMSSIAVPTPFPGQDLLYVSSGYVGDALNRPLFAIKPGARGNITLKKDQHSSDAIAWRQPLDGPYMPTPILYRDQLFVLYDRGMISSFNPKTGEPIYKKQRVSKGTAQFTASPIGYRGRLFCVSEAGDTYVIPVGKEFQVERKNPLGEMCMATPAVSGSSLLIRGIKHLYCLREVTATANNDR